MGALQRWGGIAALFAAAAFLFGFWLYFTLLAPAKYGSLSVDAATHVAFLAEHRSLLTVWNLVIYVAFGVALVVLALAVQQRVRSTSPTLASVATAFGLIWAGLVIASGMVANVGIGVLATTGEARPDAAAAAWPAYAIVVNGLGGGNEIVGGLWALLAGLAIAGLGGSWRFIGYAGVGIGASGMLTTVPMLAELGAVFGLGLVVWFAWLGIALLRTPAAIAIHASSAIT
jgi:hypothetical protein